jgi:hypothetical protein
MSKDAFCKSYSRFNFLKITGLGAVAMSWQYNGCTISDKGLLHEYGLWEYTTPGAGGFE